MSERDGLIVVALTGLARSGKDTASRFLASHHGCDRLALADPIRATFAAVSGPGWEAHKEMEAAGKSLRTALQLLGTESRAAVGNPTMWTDVALATIHYFAFQHPSPRRRFAVADLRFPAEADRFREVLSSWGGQFDVWRIERPGLAPIAESGHSSERSVADVREDAMIFNAGSLEDFAGQVSRVWRLRAMAVARRPEGVAS